MIIAMLLTPADPLSMVLLAGPMYALYEFGLLLLQLLPAERVARGFGRKNAEPDGDADNENPYAD